ncbi:MAG: hypothetical protein H6729_11855 [Deltaproteobacteria bacterium]|nr:hypothetical protein [Deltaproteobacteria bacterium]
MTLEFKATQRFEPGSARQYINDSSSVFHCHHYATLMTQLADDASSFRGPELLTQAAEEFAFRELSNYFAKNQINEARDRIAVAESYCGFVGLGSLRLELHGAGGAAEMAHSHVDEGWIKKWGKRDKPVNFIGQGFIAGACEAITNAKLGSFDVQEDRSIVSGQPSSKFTISADSAKQGAKS